MNPEFIEKCKSTYRLNWCMLLDLTTEIKNKATVKSYPPYNKSAVFMLALGEQTNEMLDELIANDQEYIKQTYAKINLANKYYDRLYCDDDKEHFDNYIKYWKEDIKRWQNEIEWFYSLKSEDN